MVAISALPGDVAGQRARRISSLQFAGRTWTAGWSRQAAGQPVQLPYGSIMSCQRPHIIKSVCVPATISPLPHTCPLSWLCSCNLQSEQQKEPPLICDGSAYVELAQASLLPRTSGLITDIQNLGCPVFKTQLPHLEYEDIMCPVHCAEYCENKVR